MPTEAAIAHAASRLFMEKGYRAVTMAMVADAAGLTKAAVYYHFQDKPSLMVDAVCSVFLQARHATEEVLSRPLPLRDRLEAIARTVLDLPQPFTAFDAMMHEASADLSAGQMALIRSEEQKLAEVVTQAIAHASARREIRTENPALVAHAFIAMLRVGQARNEDGTRRFPDAPDTAKAVLDLLWQGIDPKRQ